MWRRGGCCFVRCTNKSVNDPVSSFVQGDSPPTLPPGTPFVCTLVPMWPFTRFSWPSFRRVCTDSQSEGACSSECSGENLQGRFRTNFMVRDMDVPAPNVHDGSSWTGCPCEEGPNWPSTRRWCVHCTVMALHDDKLPSVMGLHGSRKAEERSHVPGAPQSPQTQLVVISGGWRLVVT